MAPIIADHWERASFPFEIIPKLRKLNLGASLGMLPFVAECLLSCTHMAHDIKVCQSCAGGATLSGHGCAGQSIMSAAMTVVEMARVDASCSTFLMVHNSLCMLTIGLLGSEQQKQELLPSLASLEQIGEHLL